MTNPDEKIIAILRILNKCDKPVGARIIANRLKDSGYDLGERTVRYHMQILDEKGFTERIGYSGRIITSLGRSHLKNGFVYDQVDFVFSKFEELIYKTSFDYKTATGNVVVNISNLLLDDSTMKNLESLVNILKDISLSGISVSPFVQFRSLVDKNNDEKTLIIIKSLCGTTIDGVLVNNGIPVLPIYGGLLKIEDYVPQQFSELISYEKTSMAPLNAFIANGKTSVLDVMKEGTGFVPANFRIVPSESIKKTKSILKDLAKIGISGVVSVGESGEDVLGIPVNENMIGIAIIGGVTPLCAFKELGYDINIKLAEEIIDFKQLRSIDKCEKRNNSFKKDSKDKTEFLINNILKQPNKSTNQKVSFLMPNAWNLIQKVNFDVEKGEGKLAVDISYINKSDMSEAIEIMGKAHESMKSHICPYYKIINHIKDPKIHKNENLAGIVTVCDLSANGILLNNGIMSNPKYGGLLELGKNSLFTDLISYNGSSLDPHKIFIFKNMTSITNPNINNYNEHMNYKNNKNNNNSNINNAENIGADKAKIGPKILASITEVILSAREPTKKILNDLNNIDLPLIKIGKPRELVYNAKIDNYNFGLVVGSGLNTIAAIHENNIDIEVKADQKIMELGEMEIL